MQSSSSSATSLVRRLVEDEPDAEDTFDPRDLVDQVFNDNTFESAAEFFGFTPLEGYAGQYRCRKELVSPVPKTLGDGTKVYTHCRLQLVDKTQRGKAWLTLRLARQEVGSLTWVTYSPAVRKHFDITRYTPGRGSSAGGARVLSAVDSMQLVADQVIPEIEFVLNLVSTRKFRDAKNFCRVLALKGYRAIRT